MPLKRTDGHELSPGVPTQLVEVTRWPLWCDEEDEDIRIIDMGEAFTEGERIQMHAQPRCFKAPETILEEKFDGKVDLWCAGSMVGASRLNFQKNQIDTCLARFTYSCLMEQLLLVVPLQTTTR